MYSSHFSFKLSVTLLSILFFSFPLLSSRADSLETPSKESASSSTVREEGRSWAVLFGINRYEHLPSLEFSVPDTTAIEKILTQRGFTIRTFYNKQATREVMLKELSVDLPNRVKSKDRVIIFFAGHHRHLDREGANPLSYILPVDGQADRLSETGVSEANLQELLVALPTRQVLFLASGCFGKLGQPLPQVPHPFTEPTRQSILHSEAKQMITACASGETALEGMEWGSSVFMYFLKKGLSKGLADRNRDGLVLASELHAYLNNRVSAVAKMRGQVQTPQLRTLLDGNGEFVFNLNPQMRKEDRHPTHTASSTKPSRTEVDTDRSGTEPELPSSIIDTQGPAQTDHHSSIQDNLADTPNLFATDKEPLTSGSEQLLLEKGQLVASLQQKRDEAHQNLQAVKHKQLQVGRELEKQTLRFAEEEKALENQLQQVEASLKHLRETQTQRAQELKRQHEQAHIAIQRAEEGRRKIEQELRSQQEDFTQAQLILEMKKKQLETRKVKPETEASPRTVDAPDSFAQETPIQDSSEIMQESRLPSYQFPRKPITEILGNDGGPLILIPRGEFVMGSQERRNERPRHTVLLNFFYIDKFEVTTSQYAKFLKETQRTKPNYWKDNTHVEFGDRPIVGVTWEDAHEYCSWAGKRLPSEAEWEKAARGTDERTFPWGNHDPTLLEANFGKSEWTGYHTPSPVGRQEAGKSPYGIYNLAGNVWEWVEDWYDKSYYAYSPAKNPTGPSTGNTKTIRGGGWDLSAIFLRASNRSGALPSTRHYSIGFRCAQDAQGHIPSSG